MAVKQFLLNDIGLVTVQKRRGNRNLRISVSNSGGVKVTIPAWAAFSAGVAFARSKAGWIAEHMPAARPLLKDGDTIGKAHHLVFIASSGNRISSHIRGNEIRVRHPEYMLPTDSAVQKVAETAAIRALRLQAGQLLPQRTKTLADKYGYSYRSVTIKNLSSRWGSCDQDKNIVYNLFLMQLPWSLIDYVILHELAHTRVLRHGEPFWLEMERYTPLARLLRKQVHEYQPVLHIKP